MRQLKKFIAMILECLPELDSQAMQGWIENPKSLRKRLAEALQPILRFEIWKTIEIGTGLQNADAFCHALKDNGCSISDWAKDIMRKPAFAVTPEKAELNLVKVSVAELGFSSDATRKKIYERAISMGLKLVPAEAGPQLRLQYPKQPHGEWLLMAMEPIKDSDGDFCVFGVERADGDLWLRTYYASPDGVWDDRCVFVFCK